MKRHILGVAGLLCITLAAAARAADEPVLLRYRYQPGQEFRYRLTITGDMAMTMGGANMPGGVSLPNSIPMTMNATYEMVQKVKSVSPEGFATISAGFDKLDTSMGFMGMSLTSRLGPGGKVETLMNGQPSPLAGGQEVVLPNPLTEMTLDPTGKVTGAKADSLKALNQLVGGQNLAGMFGGNMPGLGGLVLPAQPVKPGDTWETQSTAKVPLPLPGTPGMSTGEAPVLPVTYTFVNKLLRTEDGQAVIETKMTARIPAGTRVPMGGAPGAPTGMTVTIQKLDQSMTGTQLFRIAEGVVAGSDFDAKTGMQMTMAFPSGPTVPPAAAPSAAAPARKPAPKPGAARASARAPKATARPRPAPTAAAAAPAAPAGLKVGMDGTMKLKLERLTAPAAPASETPPAPEPVEVTP